MLSPKTKLGLLCLSASFLAAQPVKADLFHYNNLLIGDRALGLGGAFTAIADDASGVYYNPAGLGFALNNDISGSANARFTKETVYKDILPDRAPGQNYTETSEGSVAPFVGGLQKLDSVAKGLVFAFALYNTNNELINLNDTIIAEPDASQSTFAFEFLRNLQLKSEDFNIAVGLGYRVLNNLAIGGSLTLVSEYELMQDYQASGSVSKYDSNGDDKIGDGDQFAYSQSSQNLRQEIDKTGLEIAFGTQYAFAEKFSVGLTLKYRTLLSQTFSQLSSVSKNDVSLGVDSCAGANASTCLDAVEDYQGTDLDGGRAAFSKYLKGSKESEEMFGASQMKARLGFAYFHSPLWLLSFDVAYNGEVEKGADPSVIEGAANDFSKEVVIDYHFGTEYYIHPSFPVRFGVFTSNDTRPELDKDKSSQKDHIDYTGASLFGSWVQPNSQLGLGVTYQLGEGESQKIAGTNSIQEVESTSTVWALSAAHSF